MSRAKLPICAMWECPNVFFQKPTGEATNRLGDGRIDGTRQEGSRCSSNFRRMHGVGQVRERRSACCPLEAAAGVRPPDISRDEPALCRLLVITIEYFAFGAQPVLGFVAGREAAALREQVGGPTNFILEIDGDKIRTRFCLDDFGLAS